MPARPRWFCDVDRICAKAASLPVPVLERSHIEHLLGVSRRRAQQILEQCTTGQVGSSYVTSVEALSKWLRGRAAGDEDYEQRRRLKVAQTLAGLHEDWTRQQRLLVEATTRVVNQRLDGLPEGVRLGPGEVTVRFSSAEEGLEKLLALAMAISNDLEGFENVTQSAELGTVEATASDNIDTGANC